MLFLSEVRESLSLCQLCSSRLAPAYSVYTCGTSTAVSQYILDRCRGWIRNSSLTFTRMAIASRSCVRRRCRSLRRVLRVGNVPRVALLWKRPRSTWRRPATRMSSLSRSRLRTWQDEARIDWMAHEAIRTGLDDMVTGFLGHPVRPKTAKMNPRPPGERRTGGRQRDQYPADRIAKVPKLRLRVVVVARWKRKQQDRAGVKKNAKKKLGPDPISLLGAAGPKPRDRPRHHPRAPEPVDRMFGRHRKFLVSPVTPCPDLLWDHEQVSRQH